MNSLRQFVYRLPLIRGLLKRLSDLERQAADLRARLAALETPAAVRSEAANDLKEKMTDHSLPSQSDTVYLNYDSYFGRTQLPPPGRQPAVVVPLDFVDVVPLQKKREPYVIITNLFEHSLRRQVEFCDVLRPFLDVKGVPNNKKDDVTPYWNNGYFTSFDVNVAYAIVHALRPARIVEIGSGNSTKFFS